MDSSNESNNHEKDSCQSPINTDVFLHYSLIPSVLIILVLSFLERRAKRTKLDDTIQLLDRRFGFVIPLDLLGTFKNRWTFGFAFGAIANKVISLFFEEYLPPGVPPWARALGLFAGALEVGLSFYPIFACLTTNNVIVGSLTGFLYTLTWFVVTVMDIVACPHGPAVGKYESIIYYWPSLLCLIFLMGRFVHKFIKSIRILLGANIRHDESCFLETHQAEHVKRLFRKPTVVKKTWFEKNIYTWDPCFRFPSRMIGTSVLSIFCLYILVLMEYSVFKNIVSKMMAFQESLEAHAVDNSSEGHDNKDDLFADFTRYFIGVWYFTNIFSCAVSVTYIFHILACYRKHMKRLWRGEKEFLPVKYRIPSSTQSVTAIARYTGWQVAYILWGYLILHIVQGLFAMAFIYAFIVPLRSEIVMEYLEALGLTILTLSIVLSLGVLQIVLAGQFFLQKKISPEDKQKPLALNNRKAFHNFNYFFFFYNVILGLSACLLRLFTGLILGSWLMARIDRTILQRGYESADMGYKTWIGMIFVDHYHTNPVLVCFNNILLTARAERRLSVLSSYSNLSNISVGHNPSVKARTRWLLSYTLLKNPRLMLLRKKKETDDTDSSPTAIQSRSLQATAMEAEMRNNHKPVELHNVEIRTRHPIFE